MASTDYEKYIRTDELLALQKKTADLTCPDELQFQIVHQTAELWMKLVDFEARRACQFMAEDQVAKASYLFGRISRVMRLLGQQLDLLDTMSPTAYMTVRTGLGRGSGQESPGFKTMLRIPGEIIWPAYTAFLQKRGLTLRQIYDAPDNHPEVYALTEGLVDYDQLLQGWRYRHLLLVYRIIGVGTPSLKGKHSDLLAHGLKQQFFPELWKIRDDLYADWSKEQEAKGKQTGYHG